MSTKEMQDVGGKTGGDRCAAGRCLRLRRGASCGPDRPAEAVVIALETIPRFGVPYFFLVAGYFLKVEETTLPALLSRLVTRLVPIYLFWVLVYLGVHKLLVGDFGISKLGALLIDGGGRAIICGSSRRSNFHSHRLPPRPPVRRPGVARLLPAALHRRPLFHRTSCPLRPRALPGSCFATALSSVRSLLLSVSNQETPVATAASGGAASSAGRARRLARRAVRAVLRRADRTDRIDQ